MTLIARLRIILNDVEPMPMRHIEVPLKIRLDRTQTGWDQETTLSAVISG